MEVLIVLAILVIGAVRLSKLGGERPDHHGSGRTPDDLTPGPVPQQPGSGHDYAINPATGLPMLHGSAGGFDIEGNLYGFDDETLPMHRHPADRPLDEIFGHESSAPWINPATGLPMISDSPAGVDVGGNPYGSNLDDVSSHGGLLKSGFGSGSYDTSSFHDSFGSGSSSLDSFDSGSGSSGSGFGSDW